MSKRELNLRDLGCVGGGAVPKRLFLRSGKLSVLSREECKRLCEREHVAYVVDLRTSVEAAEFPDPLPEGVAYEQIPLLRDATIGITHETGSDPMAIIRNLRKHPEQLEQMIPDFKKLYTEIVTDEYSRGQLDKVVARLRQNASEGRCTLFHCTAGKDRTGIVSMALLKSYGVSDEDIVRDYMLTNRNAFWPTMRKCLGIGLMTLNWRLVKLSYKAFMADRKLIETAMSYY